MCTHSYKAKRRVLLPLTVVSPPARRQLLKTELGSFFTEYLQVGGLCPPGGRGCFPRGPEGPGSPPLGGRVEHGLSGALPPLDSVSPSVQRGLS